VAIHPGAAVRWDAVGSPIDEGTARRAIEAARKHGSAMISLRVWTNGEHITIERPGRFEKKFRVTCRVFSDDPVWNPPATKQKQRLDERELTELLLGRSLDFEYLQAGGRVILGEAG